MSPTQRSKRLMESEGYTVDVVEHWNAFARKRYDLFGFLDLLCLKDKVVGVQTTTAGNMAARRKKIRAHMNYLAVEGAGIKVELHGWAKVNGRWQCKRETMTAF